MNSIKIQCPDCGAVLTVEDNPANSGKNVKCPVCGKRHPFSSFRPWMNPSAAVPAGSETVLPGDSGSAITRLSGDVRNTHAGYLFHEETCQIYRLSEGQNLIGRKTRQTPQGASVPIATTDMGFSRKHLYIDAVRLPDGTIRHYAYNASNKNETTVNERVLFDEDKMVLHHGDRIMSSSTVLEFRTDEI